MAKLHKKDSAEKILIFVSIFFFLALFVFGWYQRPGQSIWGLYTDVDGQLAEWYSKSLFQWSRPFFISNINPFEGMCSLFFANNSWLNPGALALSLPFERIWTYVVSYGLYLGEVSVSIYFLSRALSLSRIQSVVAAQVFAFFLFPPFTAYTYAISFFSGAPFNAHLMALFNLSLVFFVYLGRSPSIQKNILYAVGIVILFYSAIYSSAMTSLTFLPSYGIFALGILIQDLRDFPRRSLFLWKTTPLILVGAVGLLLDNYHYFSGTAGYVSRVLMFPPSPEPLSFIDCIKRIFEVLLKYDPCMRPQESLFCLEYPVSAFHIIGVVGGLMSCCTRKNRWVALSFLLTVLMSGSLTIIGDSGLFPNLSMLHPSFFQWSSYVFYAIFFTAFFEKIGEAIKFLASRYFPNKEAPPKFLHRGNFFNVAWLSFVVPLTALYVFREIKLYEPVSIWPSDRTEIITHLEKHIKLEPQEIFKGYAISYLGAQGGGIRPFLDLEEGYLDSSVQYTKVRDYLKKHYGNWHMFSDLWQYGIPTLEEYGQWITVPLYLFTGNLLSKPGAHLYTANVNIFGLDYPVLQAIGVRFIITDSQLTDLRVREVKKIVKEEAVPLYLYELQTPNLGNYSPTQVICLKDAKDIFNMFKEGNFNFQETVVLQEKVPSTLSKAYDTSFSFGINKIRIVGKSDNASLILLPFQFSHCYKIKSLNANSTVKIMRANVVQTAVFFKDKLDVELIFDFGMTRNSQCRIHDIEDIKKLSLMPN